MNRVSCLILCFLSTVMIMGCKKSGSSYLWWPGPASSEVLITSFVLMDENNSASLIEDAAGEISNTDITITVPRGTDISAFTPTIIVSDGATVVPSSGVEQNFTTPVEYTVIADDGAATTDYNVTVQIGSSYVHTVLVEKGTFSMGNSAFTDADVIHDVNLTRDYHMSKYETTYHVWYTVKNEVTGYTFYAEGCEGGGSGVPGAVPAGIRQPVCGISWNDAIAWCNALSELEGYTPVYYTDESFTTVYKNSTNAYNNHTNVSANGYRLPTEAEWEFAARERGMREGNNYSGADYDTDTTNWPIANTVAWFFENSGPSYNSSGVGLKLPNSLGLYDMSGNILEFVYDWYSSDYASGEVADPVGPDTGTDRVVRGGQYGWGATALRTSWRASCPPTSLLANNGFRVVRIQ